MMNERRISMQALKDSRTSGYLFPGRSMSDDNLFFDMTVSHSTEDASPIMMAGAYELQKAMTSIFIDTCRRRRRYGDMLHRCWELFT